MKKDARPVRGDIAQQVSGEHRASNGARFYFANLGADVARCISAAQRGDMERYYDSLERAYTTLEYVRKEHRPEAYEEGLLMSRALEYARGSQASGI